MVIIKLVSIDTNNVSVGKKVRERILLLKQTAGNSQRDPTREKNVKHNFVIITTYCRIFNGFSFQKSFYAKKEKHFVKHSEFGKTKNYFC